MDKWQMDMLRAATKAAVALERIADALEPLAKMIEEEVAQDNKYRQSKMKGGRSAF